MEYIKRLITNLQNTIWDANNIFKVATAAFLIAFLISLIFKKSATRKFINSIINEMKKVEWIKSNELVILTFIVLAVSTVAIAIMTPLDALFVELKNQYIFK